MSRDIPVGNRAFLIARDPRYCLRDIYYPLAGKENRTSGHRLKLGLRVDGKLSMNDQCKVIILKTDGSRKNGG